MWHAITLTADLPRVEADSVEVTVECGVFDHPG
jgi:hypothetical protein